MDRSCPGCEAFTLFLSEPVYDGFEKVGERQKCTECGHILAESDPELVVGEAKPSLFSVDELPQKPQVFEEGEGFRFCRHCANYIVNPFTQRCALHDKEVQATDVCDDFTAMADDEGLSDLLG